MQLEYVYDVIQINIPKLYSTQNNMDPGPVPPELTVSYPYLST